MAYLPNPNPQPITGAIASTQSGAWTVTATVQGTSTVTATLSGISAVSGIVSATQGTSPWVTTATIQGTTPVSLAAISATQGTSPWVVSAAAVGATQSGVWAVNATVTNTAVYGVVSATQGTSPWVVSAAAIGTTQGTSPWVISAAAIGATQSGNWAARIVGNAGAVLDAATTTIAGATPPSGLVTLAVCTTNTVTTTVANAQSLASQCDYVGNLFVRPYRRSQISPAQLATLSTTTAQTLFTAGATGVYKDISNLIITPLANSTTSLPFVVNITDGTSTYHFNMQTGSSAAAATTAQAFPTYVSVNFNPPLPQSTAATTWMANLNVTTCTCSVVAVAVQSMIC